jgi:serine/threonine-protein kinase
MVRNDGLLKIIDLGFGKRIERSDDFDRSISLNWWCEPPAEFQSSRYDFKTEVYFVGKLFERLIQENEIRHFKYMDTLAGMCQCAPAKRVGSFTDVEKTIRSEQFIDLDFTYEQLKAYRGFSDALCAHVTKVENGAKYATDIGRLRVQLNEVYQRFMLEETVPDAVVVLRCFLNGMYYYRKADLEVAVVKDFLKLLRSTPDERAGVILANLHTRLDSLPRYAYVADDDVPF